MPRSTRPIREMNLSFSNREVKWDVDPWPSVTGFPSLENELQKRSVLQFSETKGGDEMDIGDRKQVRRLKGGVRPLGSSFFFC